MTRLVLAAIVALIAGCGRTAGPAPASHPNQDETAHRVLYYRNPMDASVTSPVPAKDHMGMDYVPVYADEQQPHPDHSAIQVPDSALRTIRARSVAAEKGPLPPQIRATGVVQFNQRSIKEIRLRVDGWIQNLAVGAVGETVRAGQPMFSMYSIRMESAEQEFINSLGFNDPARTAIAEKRLTDIGVEPSFIATLRETKQVPHLIPFHFPQTGTVIELNVREGAYVEPSMIVMRVASFDPAWVVAEVPQALAGQVVAGAPAQLTTAAHPDRVFDATVENIYSQLDETTRALRVRLVVRNDQGLLKPNMYVAVTLAGAQTDPVVHVPRDAVIRDGAHERVIVDAGNGRFVPREVRTGWESGEQVSVLSGLAEGERVVTSAVFLLDSETRLQSGFSRMHEGSAASAPAAGTPESTKPAQ